MRWVFLLWALSLGSPAWAQSGAEVAVVKKGVQQILKADLPVMSPDQRRFKLESIDLNGDGKREHFVFFQNSYFCGSGGCTYLLLDPQGRLITRFTVADIPVIVLTSKTKGWRDLLLNHKGQTHKLRFDGKRYPGNPSTAPAYALGMNEEEDPGIRYLFSEVGALLKLIAF